MLSLGGNNNNNNINNNDDNNNNECICKAQNKLSSDALHRRAGIESFQFPCNCLNTAGRQS